MKKDLLYFLAFAMIFVGCGKVVPADPTIAIVPKPIAVNSDDGVFKLSKSTKIISTFDDSELSYAADMLNEIVEPFFGRALSLQKADQSKQGAVNFEQDPSMSKGEYVLSIKPDKIVIRASSAQGIFYGVQTMRQLLPVAAFVATDVAAVELPAVDISDKPSLEYRGMMFDVCRHFFPIEDVKTTLDILAMHKMSVFHWHLTDDQGWRIEIKKYPKLTEIGSMRKQSLVGRDPGGSYDSTTVYDGTPHGGFYTQDQIRDVVEYAKRRFITIIPEIEIPGHAVAALASYPDLGCTGEQFDVRQTWDIDDRVFCVGKDSTLEFFEGVLSEVVELFPSELIHIGGDECPTVEWEKCDKCKARMKAEGLKTYRQLQGYTTHRLEKFLNERGRRLIGWDEILDGGVTPNATVMSWRGTKGGQQAAKLGNFAIMAPTDNCYIDYYQTKDTANEPLAIGGYVPVKKTYSLEPYEGLTDVEKPYILGVQANLWTEYIANYPQAQYMMLPRLSAISEVGWSLDRKDYDDYKVRMAHMIKLYDIYGYNYAKHIFDGREE